MLENIILKGTTICDCGRQFDIHDITKLERINDTSFYQGVVKHYSKAKCPKCGEEVILLLKQVGQTYEIVNVAIENNEITEKKAVKLIDNTIKDLKNDVNSVNEATINTDKSDTSSNEIICPECKRTFKSKSGLTNHMKTHQK